MHTVGRVGETLLVTAQRGPDLHRDKLGLADDADRQALRELRLIVPLAIAIGMIVWLAGAGPRALLPVLMVALGFMQWRAALLRRRARREYRAAERQP